MDMLNTRVTKDKLLSFRVEPDLEARIVQLAKKEERTVADTLRRLVLKAFKRAS